MKELLEESKFFVGLLGADYYIKVRILIEEGRYIDVIIQK